MRQVPGYSLWLGHVGDDPGGIGPDDGPTSKTRINVTAIRPPKQTSTSLSGRRARD